MDLENTTTDYLIMENTTTDYLIMENDTNSPSLSVSSYSSTLLIQFSSFILSAIIAVIFNGFTLAILLRPEDCGFDSMPRYTCCILAVTDTISNISATIFYTSPLFRNVKLCLNSFSILYASFTTSLALLSLVNMDRAVKVLLPLRYDIVVTRKRIVVAVALGVIIPSTIVLSIIPNRHLPFVQIYTNLCSGFAHAVPRHLLPAMLGNYSLLMVPTILTTCSNLCLLGVAIRIIRYDRRIHPGPLSMQSIADQPHADGETPRASAAPREVYAYLKSARTVLVLTLVTYVSWTPAISMFIYTVSTGRPIDGWLRFALNLLGVCSTWWNGLVYLLTNRRYRLAVQHFTADVRRCFTNAIN